MHFSKCSRLGLAWAHSANECWPTICEPQLFKIKVEQKSIATLGSLQDLNIAPVNHCDFLLDRIMIDRIIIGRTIINRIIELIKSLVWVKCRCWAFQWVSLPSYTAARQLNCDGPKELRLMKSLLNHGFWEVFNLGEIWGEGISVPRHPRLSKYPWNWLLYPISP